MRACVTMGVALRPRLKGLDQPSNPNVTVIAMRGGLRATAKDVEHPPQPYSDPGSALGGNAEL
jgi:hypothetical protein